MNISPWQEKILVHFFVSQDDVDRMVICMVNSGLGDLIQKIDDYVNYLLEASVVE